MLLNEWMKRYTVPLFDNEGDDGGTPPAGDTLIAGADGGDPPAAGDNPPKDGDKPPADDDNPPADGDDKPPADDLPPAELITREALVFPEGVEVAEELTTEFLGIMNDAELTPQARAQKIIDLQVSSAQEGVEAANEAAQTLWNTTQDQWQAEAKALPELGGAALDQTLASIKSGLEAAGATQETFDALNATGFGNHPEAIRILHTLTKAFNEGGPVGGAPARGSLTQADKMFGS